MTLSALLLAGALAGVINTLAGGGSFVTVAALLFAGLPADVANATNRLGVIFQTTISTRRFAQAGHLDHGLALRLAPATIVGALLGAWLSTDIDVALLRQIIGGVMLAMLIIVIVRPQRWLSADGGAGVHPALRHLAFFGIGAYGGFLQAGVGVFLLMGLSVFAGLDLVRANAVKVLLVFLFTLPAFGLYLANGLIDWAPGLVLAVGGAVGGGVGARLTVWGGAPLVRWVLVGVLAVSGARLLLTS
ncbi:MAG: sulfite exporter TauE/SafE family protein [Myxococcota bacterium]